MGFEGPGNESNETENESFGWLFAEFERKNVSIVLLGDKSDRVADELIENMVGGPGKS